MPEVELSEPLKKEIERVRKEIHEKAGQLLDVSKINTRLDRLERDVDKIKHQLGIM